MEHAAVDHLPYEQRRIVMVVDKAPPLRGQPSTLWESVRDLLPIVGGLPGVGLRLLWDKMRQFQDAGQAIYPIDWEAARTLRFPPGHPRKKVVYIGHPVDAGSYIPAADFHRFLFEHKIAEALRLIRCLGATEITIVHVQGWDRREAAKLGLGLPQEVNGISVDAGIEASRTKTTNRQVLTDMKLSPVAEPFIPDDLVWIDHEPLWAEVAQARMESGLKEFVVDVRSADDFGVNTGLKLLIQKTGLEAGGEFVEHKSTIWRLEGTFS